MILWVPEMALTAVDLLLRRWSEPGTIRRVALKLTYLMFVKLLAWADIRIIHTPVRAPRANAITERFIGRGCPKSRRTSAAAR